MNSIKEQLGIVDSIKQSVTVIKNVNNDNELKYAYKDEYITIEQKKRDKEITKLLEQYTKGYTEKVEMNKKFKWALFILSCIILLVFSGIFAYLLLEIGKITNKNTISGIVQTVSVCVTFLTLVIGLLKIITKYVFSDKDEEYITKIVEIIQNNDLENKKQNIMVRFGVNVNNNKSNEDDNSM